MTTSGHVADTHGLTVYDTNLQTVKVRQRGQKVKIFTVRTLLTDRFH